MTIRLNGPKDLAAFSSLKYAKSWSARGGLLTDSPEQADLDEELPIEKIALKDQKEKPKNAQGIEVGVQKNVYMDGWKYF